MATPLRGEELLKKIKEVGNLPAGEVAEACGYDGTDLTKFCDALFVANGIEFDSDTKKVEDSEQIES